MTKPLILIDQTINYGLKTGLAPDKLAELVRLLPAFSIDLADVWIADWSRLKNRRELLPLHPFRGKVKPCCREMALAHELGFTEVSVSWECRPDFENMDKLDNVLAQAKDMGLKVALTIENASAVSTHEIIQLMGKLVSHDIETLIYGDKDNLLDPFSTYQNLAALQQSLPFDLEFHGYNGYGLASANMLAAIRAGINRVAVAAGGLGEYAPLEEVIMGSHYLLKKPVEIPNNLAALCKQAVTYFNRELPVNKAIVGGNVFAHESGIHVDGVMKCPELYEPFAPEVIGLSRKLVIGKHSGTASIKAKFRTWNISITDADVAELLKAVRSKAIAQKSPLSDNQLIRLYLTVIWSREVNDIGDEELCSEENQYESLIRHCGMASRRQALSFLPRKS